jgi:predicted solute-binding protein
VPQCLDYLSDNLHYDLSQPEQLALERFYGEARKLKLAPTGRNLAAAFPPPLVSGSA